MSSGRSKKRPRVFAGNRKAKQAQVPPETGAVGDTSSVPPSASSKKLRTNPLPSGGVTSGVSAVFLRPRSTGEASSSVAVSDGALTGNRIIECSSIVSLASQMKCPTCGNSCIATEDFSSRRGLVTRIKIQCAAECGWFHLLSDSYNSNMNVQAGLASRTAGFGQTSLTTFCGMMDLPPPVTPAASADINDKVLEASTKVVREEALAASAALHDKASAGTLFVPSRLVEADNEEHEDSDSELGHVSEGSDLSDDEATDLPPSVRGSGKPLDITVTFDGTWSRRGFTALYGVVVVMS